MENKNNIHNDLEKEAPFLSKIEKVNPYTIPKNYFEVLPEVIASKNLNKSILKFYFDRLSYRILMPTTSVVIIFFVIFNWNTNPINSELTNEQLSELIIEEEYIEIEDYLVYETYAEVIEEQESETSDAEDYINYLLENDIDINSIIEEF